jgi:ATP-binding protein involved in chromosome partitioning
VTTNRSLPIPETTPESVREILSQVKDPALQVDFVSAGMVKDVSVTGGRVRVALELTTPACPSREVIVKSIQAAVGRAPGVSEVEVALSAAVVPRTTVSQNPRLPGVKNIIAVAAGKGGVGKSTVTTNLAAALYRHGASVGILDADIYGPSIPQMMGDPDVPAAVDAGNKITPAIHHGLRIISVGFFVERGGAVIWRGPMVHKLLQQFLEDVEWGTLDYLLIDLPPGTGDAQLSLSQLIPVTGAVMVTTPQEVSVIDVEKAMAMWKRVEIPVLGVVENMSFYVCPGCGHHEEIFSRGGGQRLAEREGVPFLGEVPLVPGVRGAGDAGKPAVLALPESPVAQVFMAMAARVACALSVRNLPEPGTGKRSSKLTLIR